MPTPFEYAKSFSDKKNVFDSELSEREYVPFVVNKIMSFSQNTALFANEVNKMWQIDKKMQHDFYFYGVPKSKSFATWIKKDKKVDTDDLLNISKFYCINMSKAEQCLAILSREQLDIINDKMNEGGRK